MKTCRWLLGLALVGGSMAGVEPAISHAAGASVAAAAPTAVHSFVLTSIQQIWLANGYPGLRMDMAPVRIQTTLWYASPTHWRRESRYLTPPPQPGLRRAFLPDPDTAARDGALYWSYDTYAHTATRQTAPAGSDQWLDGWPVSADPADFAASAIGGRSFTPATFRAGSIGAFIASISGCGTGNAVPYTKPRLAGAGSVAGHAAYIVDFGNRPCGWNSASAHEATGQQRIWVDQRTFFVLRSDL